ncbi:MAG: GNAT family N-acetyltransferase [Candidatus Marinimicrobia bacterium]|nr:GNAT family N-acetyltransferase [Candidatus Neomarinimicrobiota bacterium]
MDNQTESLFQEENNKSRVDILAITPGDFQLELVHQLDDKDASAIIDLSAFQEGDLEKNARFNATSVRKYFHYPKTFPLLARHKDIPVGYIVGITLESLNKESWVKCDDHWGLGDTAYIHSFFVHPKYDRLNYSRILLYVFTNWLSGLGFRFISGHEQEEILDKYYSSCEKIKHFENWQNQGQDFWYFRKKI